MEVRAGYSCPPGYKQTEVGVIPEDWEVQSLGSFCEIVAGRDLVKADYAPTDGERHPFPIYSNALTNRGLYGYSSSHQYEPDKITVTARGDIGHAVYRSTRFCAIGRLLVMSSKRACDLRFVTEFINNFVDFALESTGVPQLTAPEISKYAVALPPTRAEQEAIAEALSDADALIESLEQLLAKKRQIKQGAMQELLTGKRRLPGFSGEWEVRPLVEVAPLQRGFDLPNRKLSQGPYPVVYSNGVLNHHASFQVKGPGVVTGRSGTIGTVTYVEQNFWPHNTSLWVTSFNGNDPKFVFYLYTLIGLGRFATGSGVPTLNRNDVHAQKVSIPGTRPEQAAISTVLSDMDAGIGALQEKLAKARSIKQGMMQELLTGRIRLV